MENDVMAIFAAGMIALYAGQVQAGGNTPPRPDADTMIKACWDASLAKRSGTNAEIREGTLDTVLCLEDRIVDQFKHFAPDLKFHFAPDDDRPTTEKVREKLKEIRFSVGALYWWIYNENPGCKPSCGTLNYSLHLTANAHVLEQMLRDVVAQRVEYGF